MFQNIVWSDESCTLKTFVDSYTLPQLVKVEDGFYSEDDAKTLSAEQILMLHITKRTDKVLVKAAEGKQYFIPLACPSKVEILPRICDDRYYSVEDIVDASTSGDFKFIRVIHDGPPSFHIRAGDILKLKKTVEKHHKRFLECEFHDKTQDLVRLPLEFKSTFEPLASTEQYHLQEVLKSFKLPVRVKFTSCDTIIQDANNNIDLESLGSVLVKEVRQESTVIATSRDGDLVTVLMIPTDLDVHVFPALGAVTGDKEYARFCKVIHDGTELRNVHLLNQFKLSEFFDLPSEEGSDDDSDGYTEVKPPLPSRNSLGSKQGENTNSEDAPKQLNAKRSQSQPARKPASSEESGKPFPPPVAKKPNMIKRKSLEGETQSPSSHPSIPPLITVNDLKKRSSGESPTTTSPHYENIERSVVTSINYNTREEAGVDTKSVSRPKPKPARKSVYSVVPKGSAEQVPPALPKLKPNEIKQKSQEEEQQPHSRHSIPPLLDPSGVKKCESGESPNTLTSQNIDPHIESESTEVTANCNRPGETGVVQNEAQERLKDMLKPASHPKPNDLKKRSSGESPTTTSPHYENIERPVVTSINYNTPEEAGVDTKSVSHPKPKPAGKPVSSVVPKGSAKPVPPVLPKLKPNEIKQKSQEEEQTPHSRHSIPPLLDPSGVKKCVSGGSPTMLTSQNIDLHIESERLQAATNYRPEEAGVVQNQAQERLKDMSVSEVTKWLTKLGLSKYVERFTQESIDGNMLLVLDMEMMQDLGISSALHKRKLTMFIQKGWIPKL